VATFVGIGANHAEARERAYAAIGRAGLDGAQHRADIAQDLAAT
jgi:phosphoribosylamine--glycine ligase